MRRSRLMSLVEALANIVVGLLVAVAMQIAVVTILGLQASRGQCRNLVLVVTGVSALRCYALRRLLEPLG